MIYVVPLSRSISLQTLTPLSTQFGLGGVGGGRKNIKNIYIKKFETVLVAVMVGKGAAFGVEWGGLAERGGGKVEGEGWVGGFMRMCVCVGRSASCNTEINSAMPDSGTKIN